MTRDDYIKLHRQTYEAIELADNHGEDNCLIECSNDMFGEKWLAVRRPDWCERFYRARLKPQPKLVPWSSLDEVPLTHWFRMKGNEHRYNITGDATNRVEINRCWIYFADLLSDYEHAAPCDKCSDLVWLPCGKEVVE